MIMSSIKTTTPVATSVKKRSKLHTTPIHVTTSDFFKLRPVWIREIVPDQSIGGKCSTFCRLDPMTHPVFGRIKFVNRAFFVPMRILFKQWNDFIEQTPALDNPQAVYIPSIVPTITRGAWFNEFLTPENGLTIYSQTDEDSPAFCIDQFSWPTTGVTDVDPGYYKLTAKGRELYNLLWSLGYRLNFGAIPQSKAWFDYSDSALPLYAYLKIWLDWYSPSEYIATESWDAIFSNIDGRTYLSQIVDLMKKATSVCYQKDYFTAAWKNPLGPSNNSAIGTSLNLKDVTITTNAGSSVRVADYNSPHLIGSGANSLPTGLPTYPSEYILDALKAATDYVKRYQLAGVRAVDRYLAEFGVKLPDTILNRSTYLGKTESIIDIGDVMQSVESPDTPLGTYAGKGIGYGNGSFETLSFDKSHGEYGYYMILSVPIPDVSYYEGLNRIVMHKTPLDFFHGDFDSLGCQAINVQEIISCNDELDVQNFHDSQLTPESVFGFTSRYGEYKHDNDILSGRMILDPAQYFNWHLFRKCNNDSNATAIGSAFLQSQQSQFSRIFADTNSLDHIQTIYQFEFDYDNPYSDLFEDYEFDDSHHNKQDINIDGTRFD